MFYKCNKIPLRLLCGAPEEITISKISAVSHVTRNWKIETPSTRRRTRGLQAREFVHRFACRERSNVNIWRLLRGSSSWAWQQKNKIRCVRTFLLLTGNKHDRPDSLVLSRLTFPTVSIFDLAQSDSRIAHVLGVRKAYVIAFLNDASKELEKTLQEIDGDFAFKRSHTCCHINLRKKIFVDWRVLKK